MRNHLNITNEFSVESFEKIKLFILKNGDRKTFRNFDNNNPHYVFDTFDLYLGAEIGQKNSYNDEKISDFNELTIYDRGAIPAYYKLKIVRKGDQFKQDIYLHEGMLENNVYLMDESPHDIYTMKKMLLDIYFKKIEQLITTY